MVHAVVGILEPHLHQVWLGYVLCSRRWIVITSSSSCWHPPSLQQVQIKLHWAAQVAIGDLHKWQLIRIFHMQHGTTQNIMGQPAICISLKTVKRAWAMCCGSAWKAEWGSKFQSCSQSRRPHWSCNHSDTWPACQQHSSLPVLWENPAPWTADASSAGGSSHNCGITRCIKTCPCRWWGVPLTWVVLYEHARPPGSSSDEWFLRLKPLHGLM